MAEQNEPSKQAAWTKVDFFRGVTADAFYSCTVCGIQHMEDEAVQNGEVDVDGHWTCPLCWGLDERAHYMYGELGRHLQRMGITAVGDYIPQAIQDSDARYEAAKAARLEREAKEPPEFPIYIGSDGEEHGEF